MCKGTPNNKQTLYLWTEKQCFIKNINSSLKPLPHFFIRNIASLEISQKVRLRPKMMTIIKRDLKITSQDITQSLILMITKYRILARCNSCDILNQTINEVQ